MGGIDPLTLEPAPDAFRGERWQGGAGTHRQGYSVRGRCPRMHLSCSTKRWPSEEESDFLAQAVVSSQQPALT